MTQEEQRLAERPQLERDIFVRPLPRKVSRIKSTMALLEACLMVLCRPNSRPEAAPVYRLVLARIRQMLMEDPAGGEHGHFLPPLELAVRQGADRSRQVRGAVASTFAACLKLVRQGEDEEKTAFEPVRIRRAAVHPSLEEVDASVYPS